MEETKENSQVTTILGEDLDETKVETKTDETPSDEVKNYLSDLVGEGKKYKTEEDLAKAYKNADNFIETLKNEKRELEAEVNKAKTIEDVLNAISNPDDGDTAQPTETIDPEPTSQEPTQSQLSPVDLNEAVAKVLADQKKKDSEQSNINLAWEQLDKAFGDREKAKVAVRDYIDGDDNVKNVLDILGRSNPNKLVEMVTANKKSNVSFIDTKDNSVSMNEVDAISNTNITWEQVRTIKKNNPEIYNSKAFKAALHKAANDGRLIY